MNLCEGWIGEECASFISAIRRRHVAATRIRRKIEHVAVAAAGQYDGVRCVPLDFSRAQISSDDSLGLLINDHQVEHLCERKHLHSARGDLATQRLITA